MIGYYRHFILQFAQVASPLTQLLRKNVAWHWGKEQEEAFQVLVQRLSSIPVLGHLDPSLPLVVYTDASLEGLGAVLAQQSGSHERPLYFLSRRLKDEESRWHSNELECLAVVWALKRLRPYVYGRDVVVIDEDGQYRRTITTPEEGFDRQAGQVGRGIGRVRAGTQDGTLQRAKKCSG